MPETDWQFLDPPNVATFTTGKVMTGEHVIDYVCHDEDDGGWQFLSHAGGGADMTDAMLVALKNVVSVDPSIEELADLPLGWFAVRRDRNSPWTRASQSENQH